uniref:Uncharacterized protein n=1 Tax=Plectus sambesii TaxID=2011161 RepID=A0A914X3M4_9BILA
MNGVQFVTVFLLLGLLMGSAAARSLRLTRQNTQQYNPSYPAQAASVPVASVPAASVPAASVPVASVPAAPAAAAVPAASVPAASVPLAYGSNTLVGHNPKPGDVSAGAPGAQVHLLCADCF